MLVVSRDSLFIIFVVVLFAIVLPDIRAGLFQQSPKYAKQTNYSQKDRTLSPRWDSDDECDYCEEPDFPYRKTKALFSPAERSFLGVLCLAVGDNAKIFGKVRVADVVMPERGLSRSDWQKAFNKISRKHFDFLLCSNEDLSVICAIELNDSSHQSKKRQQRDEFLKGVCNAAGIPLLQIPAKQNYAIEEINQLIAPHINIKEPQTQDTESQPQKSVTHKKVCPMCSSPMAIRVARKGSNAGQQFWTCSAYPKCLHIEVINA